MIQNLASLKPLAIATAGGITGGAVYVLAALDAAPNPVEYAPDLKTAVYMLAVAIMGAGLKAGMPNKTAVKGLEERLIEWAERDKEASSKRSEFRENLARWMSKVDSNQEQMKETQLKMSDKLDAVSDKVIAIEAKFEDRR